MQFFFAKQYENCLNLYRNQWQFTWHKECRKKLKPLRLTIGVFKQIRWDHYIWKSTFEKKISPVFILPRFSGDIHTHRHLEWAFLGLNKCSPQKYLCESTFAKAYIKSVSIAIQELLMCLFCRYWALKKPKRNKEKASWTQHYLCLVTQSELQIHKKFKPIKTTKELVSFIGTLVKLTHN